MPALRSTALERMVSPSAKKHRTSTRWPLEIPHEQDDARFHLRMQLIVSPQLLFLIGQVHKEDDREGIPPSFTKCLQCNVRHTPRRGVLKCTWP